ncbi:MAG: PLP-dependent aminotransferase family protein [Geminicoccales bacterium]
MYLTLDGCGPRYAQLIRALKAAMLSGRIVTGTRLPATRTLAGELGLSRNTVLIAYDQLRAEGFVEGRVGAGTYVAALTVTPRPQTRQGEVPAQSRYTRRLRRTHESGFSRKHRDLAYNLQYGEPVTNPAVMRAWQRELGRAAVHTRFDYPDIHGLPSLRDAVCDYLARRRGIQAQHEDVLIVNGAQQAFALAARVLVEEGETVVLEDPNYFGTRQIMQAHGARIAAVRTDAEGLVCAALPASGVRLVCVTPSHQFPGGSVLSLSRRLELLRYAGRQRCWIVEDDYDGEFRYDAHPLAALRALDEGDRVIYVGTFSKMLFPSLRLGFMVLPVSLRDDFAAAKRLADMGTPAIEQAALASFMTGAGFERHLRQASRTLKARRRALLSGLRRQAGQRVEIVDSQAGMHVVVWLRGYSRAGCEALVDRARRYGLGLYSIAPHYMKPPARQGLLLGYAALPVAEIEEAMRLFGRCLDEEQPVG